MRVVQINLQHRQTSNGWAIRRRESTKVFTGKGRERATGNRKSNKRNRCQGHTPDRFLVFRATRICTGATADMMTVRVDAD